MKSYGFSSNGHVQQPRKKKRPRRVDFQSNRADHRAALLGALGFSNNAIMRETHLSDGRITYRLKKAGIKRMDFRNGKGTYAEIVMTCVTDVADAELIKHLRSHNLYGEQHAR